MPPTTQPSPLASAALAMLHGETPASDLAARFGRAGASIDPAAAQRLLDELVALGLARVARAAGGVRGERDYVLTSLGQQVLDASIADVDQAARLAELEHLRTDLLSTIAHELRTPLTAVRTCLGLLLDPAATPTESERRTLLDTAERNAERMQRLVGDILELARFRAGGVTLQLRRFDAVALARSAVASLAPVAASRAQRVDLVAPADPVWVYGDHRRIEQALVNLVSNAQKFTPEGGAVTVGVEPRGPEIRWVVSDEGPGIPLADRARLFERFFVGRNDPSAAAAGVGLGLPTALAIAQAHGGTIDVRSRPGGGSRFSLVVPAAGPNDQPE